VFVAIEHRPERLLQQIFAECCVRPSAKEGVLGDTNKLDISGDGTCIKSGGSPYGKKVCDCIKKGIYNCKCHRRFSDPEARHGWNAGNFKPPPCYAFFKVYFIKILEINFRNHSLLKLFSLNHQDKILVQ